MNRFTLSVSLWLLVACGGGESATPTTVAVLQLSDLSDAAIICPETGVTKLLTLESDECGLTVDVNLDGRLKVNYHKKWDEDDRGVLALQAIADVTDCWSAADYGRMLETSFTDGPVESRNGRTSWTYHVVDGLRLTCQPVLAACHQDALGEDGQISGPAGDNAALLPRHE